MNAETTTDKPAAEELESVAALAAAFDAEIPADIEAWPLPLVLSPRILAQHSIARVVRLTLKVAARAGSRGIRVDHLKQVYQALQVPPALADLIERKLTRDGMGTATCGRLYVQPRSGSWARLASEKAS
jgi:hypothetical protein